MRAIARALSRIGRRRTFPRRLPAALGGFWFPASLEGGLKYARPTRSIDPELTNFAKTYVRPGDVVWDIGANVGLFTCAAAGLVGSGGYVVAVEADGWLAENLRRAARWNRAANISVVSAAAADHFGVAAFNIAERSRAVNHLAGYGAGDAMIGGIRERQYVPVLTLDSLAEHLPRPRIVKIDVEGGEVALLRGATRILQCAEVLLLEVYSDHAAEVRLLLDPYGYQYYDTGGRRLTELSYNTIAVKVD